MSNNEPIEGQVYKVFESAATPVADVPEDTGPTSLAAIQAVDASLVEGRRQINAQRARWGLNKAPLPDVPTTAAAPAEDKPDGDRVVIGLGSLEHG